MIGEAQVSFVGNISQDPELRFTTAGHAVCNFSVAVAGRRKNAAGTFEDGPTSFYRVTAWRDTAQHIAESLNKGDRVVVVGSLSVREYVKDDVTGRSVEVDADEVSPSLRFATCKVQRVIRTAGTPALVGAGASV